MAAGCIPVIVIDHYVLPFEDVIDWQKAAVRLYEGRPSCWCQNFPKLSRAPKTSLGPKLIYECSLLFVQENW